MPQDGYSTTRRWPTVEPTSAEETTPNLDYWNQPVFGNMPLSRTVNLFGSLASAISPQSAGGRMGRALSGMAEPYEQANLQRESLLDFARREARAKTATEQKRQRRLGSVMDRLEPDRGGLRLFNSPQEIPEGRVGSGLTGVESPPTTPQVGPADVADLFDLMPKEGAAAMVDYFRNAGQMPTAADATTRRAIETAQNPELQGLFPPGAVKTFQYGQHGLGFDVRPRTRQETGGPPPATPFGSFRPAWTNPMTGAEYPAVSGGWSPKASSVAAGASLPTPEGGWNQAPLLPSQAAPPATVSGATRPGYDAGGVSYPAVEPQYPFNQSVAKIPPSYSFFQEGQKPRVALGTPRQTGVVLPAGASLERGGKIVATAPQTGGQSAATAARSPVAAKANPLVTAAYNRIRALQDIPPTPGRWGTSWGSNPGQNIETQVEAMKDQTRDAVSRRALDVAWDLYLQQQVEGGDGEGGAATQAATPKAPVTITGPGGQKLLLQNGQWVPYGR